MTIVNYNNKRLNLARILILCGILQGLEACSTTINFSDGIIVGETAQREYNKRISIKKYQAAESLDRDSLQRLLDKEV